MVTAKKCRAMCLALEDASEAAHFDRAVFRTSQRIYATLAADEKSLNVKLTPEQQELLVSARPQAFAAIDNAWGKQGWTTVTLAEVDDASLRDALAWAHVLAMAKKKPAKKRSR